VDAFVGAVETFFDHLVSVDWRWLLAAVVAHLGKIACRTRAWRNIVAAAYPAARVRWRHIAGAWIAGAGVNAVVPIRGGDLVRLFLAKRGVVGATYPTLASTMVVETAFDLVVSLALFLWALERGALPGLDVLPRLRAFDLNWIIDHPFATAAIAVALAALVGVLVWRARPHVVSFRRRLAQGFAVFGDRGLYLRTVVTWQAADWVFRLVTVYCFLKAFGIGFGIAFRVDLENALLVQVTQSLSTLVPITPAGIGTEQALVAYVLGGKATVTALVSFSVGMKLVLIVVNAAIGFTAIALMLRTLRWRRHAEQDRLADAGAASDHPRPADTVNGS
jgi:hypothetical protein